MRITKEQLKQMIRESLQDYVRQIDPKGAAKPRSAADGKRHAAMYQRVAGQPSHQKRLEAWADKALENPEEWIKKYPDEDDQEDLARLVQRVKDGKTTKEKFMYRIQRFVDKKFIDPPEGWPFE